MNVAPLKIKSERQLQIVHLASTGLTDKEIAIHTGLAVGTLRTYWDRLRTRYGCRNRSELIVKVLSQETYEKLTHHVLDSLPLFIWKTGVEGIVEYRNDWFGKVSTVTSVKNQDIEAFMQPEERQLFTEAWQRARRLEQPLERLSFLSVNGLPHPKLHKLCVYPVRRETRKVDFWLGYGREVAEDADTQMLSFLTALMV